ncbi:MAG TPA: integrase arm-type DNA-binding domain-containing protein, partial [Xanthobacteraceae bacterium]|nr:integrase arm-type DNA-binding domain-containing protein [Xanthobacteraceae bacterium]
MKLIKANLPAIQSDFAAYGKADKIYFDDDLPGFGLRLRKGGRRGTWVCRYEYAGIQRKLTLGSTALLGPDEARELAKKAMAYKDWFGQDPQVKKAEERAKQRVTLRYVANQYLRAKEREGLRPKSLSDATRYLLKSFRPLHNLPVHQIARRDIAVVLNDLAETSPAAAGQARAYLSALFVWAVAEGLVENNPVAGTNNPGGAREPRDRVLANDELIQIWNACADDDGGRIVKLLILTGQRRVEIGGMSWDEFNRDSGTWTLPGSRSKNRREHALPLP